PSHLSAPKGSCYLPRSNPRIIVNMNLIVIPARMGSTRFHGKPLAQIRGMTMLERVWRIALAVKGAQKVIATDSPEIAKFAESFGAKVVITSEDCATGMDRGAE